MTFQPQQISNLTNFKRIKCLMEIEDKMFLSFQDIQKVGCISADFPMIKLVDAAR